MQKRSKGGTMIRTALAVLAAGVLLAAGCGGDDDDNGGGAAAPSPKAKDEAAVKKEKAGETVKVVGSQFGRILADGSGQALYLFDKERTRTSECYGACAEAWPPVLTEGRPQAGSGADAKLLGTTKRRDGKLQVTYRGRPVYLYKDDSPGKVLCHNVDEFGGLWLVVKPDGTPVS
jgi:predicted lipoprotein with Yx(FWY)xxD motif